MVLVQKWPFLQLFFLANISQQNVFYLSLERKNTFLGYKNNKFKKSKSQKVKKSKSQTHGLVQKWPFLQLFFLTSISEENVFYVILE